MGKFGLNEAGGLVGRDFESPVQDSEVCGALGLPCRLQEAATQTVDAEFYHHQDYRQLDPPTLDPQLILSLFLHSFAGGHCRQVPARHLRSRQHAPMPMKTQVSPRLTPLRALADRRTIIKCARLISLNARYQRLHSRNRDWQME